MQSHEHNVVQAQLNHPYNSVQSVSEKISRRANFYRNKSRKERIQFFLLRN